MFTEENEMNNERERGGWVTVRLLVLASCHVADSHYFQFNKESTKFVLTHSGPFIKNHAVDVLHLSTATS